MPMSRKPKFKRGESWRLKRIGAAWRRPRGVTSRMRKEKGGWPLRAKTGYATSSRSRNLHPIGLAERLVERPSDLEGLDSKSYVVRLSARLGERKRLVLLEKARQAGLHIVNPGRERVESVEGREPEAPATERASDNENQEDDKKKQASDSEERNR